MLRVVHRIPHIIRKGVKKMLPTSLMFFDTETKAKVSTTMVDKEIHKLWFGYANAFRYEDQIPTREKTCYFTTTKGFWDFFINQLDYKRPLYCFAHNMAFDLTITDFWRMSETLGFEIHYAVLESTPFIVHGTYQDKPFWLVDTFNYWKTSLADIGKSFGVKKLKMPEGDILNNEWKIYCATDVAITRRAVLELICFIKENNLGKFSLTAAGLAYNTYKHRFMYYPLAIHDNQKVLKLERASYYGGLVNNFYIGRIERKKIYKLDVNSLYPYVMLNNYPTKLLHKDYQIEPKRLYKNMRKEAAVACVELVTTDNTYPRRVNKKLVEASGHYMAVLCGAELKHALACDEVQWVHFVAYYESKPIFKDYVEYFYAKRMEAKQKGDDVHQLFLKLLLNSLYGKFGQRSYDWVELNVPIIKMLYGMEGVTVPEMYKDKLVQPTNPYTQSVWIPQDYPGTLAIRSLGGLTQVRVPIGEHQESMPIVAAYVTSYARQYLRELINLACKENVYYCDTDSIFCSQQGFNNLDKAGYINPIRLGALKIEGVETSAEFFGPKDYLYGGKQVIKGISKNAKQLSKQVFQQVEFEGIKSIIARNCEPYITIKTVRKELSRKYTKGNIQSNGRVLPLVLEEEHTDEFWGRLDNWTK